jgi:hypothetical protein
MGCNCGGNFVDIKKDNKDKKDNKNNKNNKDKKDKKKNKDISKLEPNINIFKKIFS